MLNMTNRQYYQDYSLGFFHITIPTKEPESHSNYEAPCMVHRGFDDSVVP